MRVALWSAIALAACGRPDPQALPEAPVPEARDARLQTPSGTLEAGSVLLGASGLSALDLLVGRAEAQERPSGPGAAEAPSVDIRADTLSLDGEAQRAVFSGSVSLTRGAMRLTCDRLTATYGASGKVVAARAEGAVRFRRADVSVVAPSATLDLVRSEVVLSGPARLERGGDFIQGDRIVVSIDRERVTVQGARGQLRLADGRSPEVGR